jgi:gluconokinase
MIVLVMGVSGCGKSTVGRALADALDAEFIDADDFHPPANIEKMSAGQPLDDTDRAPWLARLRDELAARHRAARPAVIACSALKERYRAILRQGAPDLLIVHLTGTPGDIATLMARRTGHFMKPGMIASQFAALEPPARALTLSVLLPVPDQITAILHHLGRG